MATINKHKQLDAGKHLVAIGQQIQKGWEELAKSRGLNIEITGIPPLSHFSFKLENDTAARALFVQMMLGQGFLASNSFYSMYAHNADHVEAYLKAVDRAFAEIADAISAGDLEKRLVGKPAAAGFKRIA